MKGYNFEKPNKDFDKTVKLDKINEEVRKHEENKKAEEAAARRAARGRKPEDPKPFRYFTIIIIIVCIAAFIIVFSLAYKKTSRNASEITDKYEETIKADEVQKEEYQNTLTEFSALIKSMPDSSDKALTLYDISGNITRTLYPADDVSLSEFSKGDIVDVSANLYLSKLEKISKNNSSFKLGELTGFSYDAEGSAIKSDSQSYNVTKETIFTLNNEITDISALDEHDVISISGLDKSVFFVNVDKAHGTIVLENASTLTEGQLVIDDGAAVPVTGNISVNVAPGTHKISLTGSNINAYSTEAFVSSGDSYKLDISKIPKKTGALSIKANVSDFYVSIDGGAPQAYNPSENLIVPPGTHTISISKEGYRNFTTTVDVSNAYAEVKATLEKDVHTGTLTVVSNPDEAEVYINGDYKGVTPYIETLEYDTYHVSVQKEGYKSYSDYADVKGEHQSVECVLTPIEED
ncbi:MAG: PEGA domain-containing protein [Firmicutes bacterium]|nr:PEGA domain-containing protein [Bacillota bacterium]